MEGLIFLLFIAVIVYAYKTYKKNVNKPKERTTYNPEIIREKETGIRMNVPGSWKYEDIYLQGQNHAEEFFETYKSKLESDPDYKNDTEYIPHYKYYPVELPCRIEGTNVYSYIKKDDWIKIGTLESYKIDVIEEQNRRLKLYPNIYKLKRNGQTEELEDHKYFAFPYSL